jgi:Protein of unknown function (DUF1351)
MVNEIIDLDLQGIILQKGIVQFNRYNEIKSQALELADQIRSLEVDEENVKQSKKLLAAVNKRVKELEDQRILIKNFMMEPYSVFEKQVKEIVGIVKEADEVVRKQVKELEENEREEKRHRLETLFNLRIKHYSFRDLFSFGDFLKPKHLNKTQSIEATEKEMIEFLEMITRDLKAIESMPEAEKIFSFYVEVKDLASALTLQQKQKEREKQIEAANVIKKDPSEKCFLITIEGEKDFKFVEMFMNSNNIKFTVKEVV